MANRRMFSNRIANSARFLQMPEGAQLLYFHMVQRADDDGVVECYPLMKLLGTAPDNFKVLLIRGFVRQLNEDQVSVIIEWLEHNHLRPDRKVDSIYKNLLLEKAPDIKIIEAKPRSDVEDNSKRTGGPSTDGLGKVRIGKDTERALRVEVVEEISEKPARAGPKCTPQMEEVFAVFDDNPARSTWKLRTLEREAAKVLFDTYGVSRLKTRYAAAKQHRGEYLCPEIHTPMHLLDKMPSLENFMKNL